MAIRKGNKHQLGLFFLFEACQRNAAGDPRQSDQRTQSFHFPIVVHQSLDLLLNRALKRQAPCLYMHFEVRALDRLRVRTCRRVGSTRRRGNHMHDHSRFQRDINDVTGVSLSLSLSLSQKSLTHNIGSASALPIIQFTVLKHQDKD